MCFCVCALQVNLNEYSKIKKNPWPLLTHLINMQLSVSKYILLKYIISEISTFNKLKYAEVYFLQGFFVACFL